ncbi:MAG: MotA/TolQ/ExbB proton channel family protein [Gammaproteobacteria bacterium]|nr:MotA/TolQ/ExbB proton channel family protein [Gammaproteobacteria bacterium]
MEINSLSDLVRFTWTSAATLVELGGSVVAVQLFISIIGLAMVFYKVLQFWPLRAVRFDGMRNAIDRWNAGESEPAAQALAKNPLSIAKDVAFGLNQLATADREVLRDELARRGMQFLRPYGKLLRTLEIVYYLSPVLGLLGTVLGMIDAFRHLAAVAGSEKGSSALANGIWQALVCTAVGLVIAILFTTFHAALQTRLERISEEVSDVLTRVLTTKPGRV